jgi:glycosyltransferase involved in cell wall biosynthesis
MKILYVSEVYYPIVDGGSRATRKIAISLAKRGHKVFIITAGTKWKEEIQIDENTIIFKQRAKPFVLMKGYHWTIYPSRRTVNLIEKLSPDVIHVHNPYALGFSALWASRKFGIPLIGSNHLLPENFALFSKGTKVLAPIVKKLAWSFLSQFYNRCDLVIVPTSTAVKILKENKVKVKCVAISNGIEFEKFQHKYKPMHLIQQFNIPEKPIVMYTGRLSGEKQIDVLIKAIPYIISKVDAHFLICGEGRQKKYLKNLARKLNVEKNITFIGFLDEHEHALRYKLADVFVMPSLAELQSIVTLEALASGLPVVAADQYALSELVHDGKNGYLFKPGSYIELAEKVVKILTNKELKEKMGKESINIAKLHDLKNVISQFEKVYEEIIHKRVVPHEEEMVFVK